MHNIERILIPGDPWIDVITQIMYPDMDHMLIADVNGARVSHTSKTQHNVRSM